MGSDNSDSSESTMIEISEHSEGVEELDESMIKDEYEEKGAVDEPRMVEEDSMDKLECLNANLTSNEVSSDVVQYLVVNIEELTESLAEEVKYQIDSIRMEQFFSRTTQSDLLASFPLLRLLYQKYVPQKISVEDFWCRFIWAVHYYHWRHHKQDFSIEEVTPDGIPSEELSLLSDEFEEDENVSEVPVEIIKLDYHSVNRYIASAILAFLKVFIVCAVLSEYAAPWYYYLYPALWVVIGFLIILRALQIQRLNNQQTAKLAESEAEGIELREMESV